MKVPFVGPSYQMDALSFGVQRSINMFPLMAEVAATKSVSALRGTAGYTLFAVAGDGPCRGSISSTADRSFVVSGQGFYEVLASGTTVLHGNLNTFTDLVSMAENVNQVMVVDGEDGWIFDKTSDTFTQITDVDFPTTSYVTYQDGYFIVTEDETQNFWISALNNGLVWDALDFTAVESSPDDLVVAFSDNGNLWLGGNRSVEVYQNTGGTLTGAGAGFPFERIAGAVIQTGVASRFTFQKFDNSVVWLGVDEQGQGVVWIANGYSAQRISTQAIEKLINEANDFTAAFSWVYHEQGHIFYVLQIAELETSLVYDGNTGQWHERMFKNPDTNLREIHRGSTQFFFDRKNLVTDRTNGNIYELSLNFQDDNGDEQIRERISPHYQDEKRLMSYSTFELDMEYAVGLTTGQGSDPQIMMQYSDDGGRNWSNELWQTIGKQGVYTNRVIWRQLGRGRDRVFKVRVSDPVFVQINEALINSGV
jgi:hypothetical protein